MGSRNIIGNPLFPAAFSRLRAVAVLLTLFSCSVVKCDAAADDAAVVNGFSFLNYSSSDRNSNLTFSCLTGNEAISQVITDQS